MKNKQIKVMINGCFDILNLGHILLIKEALKIGNYLLIAINSNSSIEKLKNRTPVFTNKERCKILHSIKGVNIVVLFDTEKELENIIKKFKPEYLIKGSDWKGKPITGEQYTKLVFIDRFESQSTTNILNKIKNAK